MRQQLYTAPFENNRGIASGQRHGIFLAILLLLTGILTWPLTRYLTTHVPGNGVDDPSLAWNLWWVRTRLIDQLNPDIFHTGWMFHPIEINLAFYTLTPLNGLLSTPIQLATDLIVASNLILLSSYVIGGYGAFLLCRQILAWEVIPRYRSGQKNEHALWLAAGVAGIVYAFSSAKLFYAALGQFNIASSHWIPFCIIYLLRIHQGTSQQGGKESDQESGQLSSQPNTNQATSVRMWRNTFFCGLFLTMQAWAELTYASFLLIFILLYVFWLWLQQLFATPPRLWLFHSWRVLKPFMLLAVIFLAGISPFLAVMLPDMQQEGDFFTSGGGFADFFSADLVGYLLPTRLHPLIGDWVGELHKQGFSNDIGQHIYLGYIVGLLCFIGGYAWLRENWIQKNETSANNGGLEEIWIRSATIQRGIPQVSGWFWIGSFSFFWALTLGPAPRWFGQPLPFPGPFAFISQLPFFSGNRYPSRYSVMLLICAAILVAYGLYWLLTRQSWTLRRESRSETRQVGQGSKKGFSGWVTYSILALFLLEHLSIPLPLNRSVTPSIYNQLAEIPEDFTLLELPTGWRNGAYVLGPLDKLIMMQQWYQSIHGKERLGGNTSRNPWYKFEYFVNAPLIGDLIILMNGHLPHIAPVVDAQIGEIIARNRALAPTVLDFFNIRFITVRVEKSPPALLNFIEEALPLTQIDEWHGTDWDGQPETIRLYRVHEMDMNTVDMNVIEMSSPLASLALAEGWAPVTDEAGIRYATRSNPSLIVDFPLESGILEVEWFGKELEPWLNGKVMKASQPGEAIAPGQFRTQYLMPSRLAPLPELKAPPELAVSSTSRLLMRFGDFTQPTRTLLQAPDKGWPIGMTGKTLLSGNALLVQSAGAESGKFARIYLNGKNVADQQRGYNMAAFTADGNLLDAQTFDTIAGGGTDGRMAQWIRSWSSDTIIAGAAADAVDEDGGGQIGQDLMNALSTIGVQEDIRGRHRWAHAFVGVVGAPPGSALEIAQLAGIINIALGAPVDAPVVFGGIKSIRFIATPGLE
ncbi:MAG: interleukin-like EMT inducer domain-containing protein [Chloroflexota bacterium]